MRVISNPMGGSELTRAFLEGRAPVEWYPTLQHSHPGDSLAENARAVAAKFEQNGWLAPLIDAFGASAPSPARSRLERASGGGLVVTTGQQPGLFGGPMYTLSKALSALALANELEKTIGLPVAPVFWAATDDADFAEASSIVVPSSSDVLELRVRKVDDVQRPLANEPLPDMRAVVEEFLRSVGSSSSADVVQLVRDIYLTPNTVGSSYLRLLRGLLEPLGISVLDAAHPQVRKAGRPLLHRALLEAETVGKALKDRNAAIKAANFKVQVREVASRSLVFRYSSEGKERISIGHALKVANAVHAADLSPTVLLRPIMERAILPTAAYVAGPAEIAYFAQVSAVADALAAEQPVVVPRWSGTILEPRVERILARYNLKPEDFAMPHALETRQARASIPAHLLTLLAGVRDSAASITGFSAEGQNASLVPETVVAGLRRDLDHRLDRFERRLAAAVKRMGTEELRDIQAARASLYPLGKAQERTVSFVALLARYGSELHAKVLQAASEHVAGLK